MLGLTQSCSGPRTAGWTRLPSLEITPLCDHDATSWELSCWQACGKGRGSQPLRPAPHRHGAPRGWCRAGTWELAPQGQALASGRKHVCPGPECGALLTAGRDGDLGPGAASQSGQRAPVRPRAHIRGRDNRAVNPVPEHTDSRGIHNEQPCF